MGHGVAAPVISAKGTGSSRLRSGAIGIKPINSPENLHTGQAIGPIESHSPGHTAIRGHQPLNPEAPCSVPQQPGWGVLSSIHSSSEAKLQTCLCAQNVLLSPSCAPPLTLWPIEQTLLSPSAKL